jgi:DNA-binding XRE family transcriptional regulator
MATQVKKRPKKRSGKTPVPVLPVLPPADEDGHYPAAETIQVIIAQQIIERRHQAGLSQADLAKRAGVRQETISRLESGKHAPNVRTVAKIDRALADAGA